MNYFEFLKLSSRRLTSKEDYLRFQKFQEKWSTTFKRFNLKSKNILDLGSGGGGYSLELSNTGAKVFAIDLNMTQHPQKQGQFFQDNGDCNNLPIRSGLIDFIFCSSLIEHVSDQEQLIFEINRVLKKQGICYLSFPPFYSPVGGHQFKSFHHLGEGFAITLSRFIYGLNSDNLNISFGNRGLYPASIQKVLNLFRKNNFKIIDITTRFSQINFAKIPIFNEILTWHVEFIVQKRGKQ